MLANKITLNKEKTEMIIFHRKGTTPPPLKIKLNGEKLYPSQSIKYVGVLLDPTLSFEPHCIALGKKLTQAIGILCKVRYFMQREHLKMLYYAIFSSHLTYGCQVWAQTETVQNRKIFNLQTKALKIMNFTFTNSDLLYYLFDILKLSDIVKLQNCVLVHNSLAREPPVCFHDQFVQLSNAHEYTTRNSTVGFLLQKKENLFLSLKFFSTLLICSRKS